MKKKKIIAYLDASNLKKGVDEKDWKLDYKSFYVWLRQKFQIDKVILFIGFISDNYKIYNYLQRIGFTIIFKEALISKDGKIKGNVDSELVLEVAKNYYENEISEVILVTGDGDYSCLVEFLKEKKVPVTIVAPNKDFLSLLLKKTGVKIINLQDFRNKLNKKHS